MLNARSATVVATVLSSCSVVLVSIVLPLAVLRMQRVHSQLLDTVYQCKIESTNLWRQVAADPNRAKRQDYGCSCQQGPPGSAGTTGQSGPPGEPGMIGANGRNGRPGKYVIPPKNEDLSCQKCPPAVQGAPGLPGNKGSRGKAGNPGVDGTPGIPGRQGPPGPPGVRGMPGSLGVRGPPGNPGRVLNGAPQGPPGMLGAIGARGKPGNTGIDGVPGPNGLPGIRGDQGPRGSAGQRGLPGPPGAVGVKGRPGSCSHCEGGSVVSDAAEDASAGLQQTNEAADEYSSATSSYATAPGESAQSSSPDANGRYGFEKSRDHGYYAKADAGYASTYGQQPAAVSKPLSSFGSQQHSRSQHHYGQETGHNDGDNGGEHHSPGYANEDNVGYDSNPRGPTRPPSSSSSSSSFAAENSEQNEFAYANAGYAAPAAHPRDHQRVHHPNAEYQRPPPQHQYNIQPDTPYGYDAAPLSKHTPPPHYEPRYEPGPAKTYDEAKDPERAPPPPHFQSYDTSPSSSSFANIEAPPPITLLRNQKNTSPVFAGQRLRNGQYLSNQRTASDYGFGAVGQQQGYAANPMPRGWRDISGPPPQNANFQQLAPSNNAAQYQG